MKTSTKLWILILILIILSPLGLFMPEYFKAGSAWGEWGAEEIGAMAGYVPQGLAKLSQVWSAPIPDYSFKSWEEADLPAGQAGLMKKSIAYVTSAVTGIAAVVLLVFVFSRFLIRKE